MADHAERRLHGAVLSTATVRLLGGIVVLVAYLIVLRPGSAAEGADQTRASAERWLAASRDAFEAKRYPDALEPTLALTRAFPNQQVYAERLALVYQHLNRPADEAAAWERFVSVSPTPWDACPTLPEAYVRAGGYSAAALEAFERCAALEPSNPDMIFYVARARERAGKSEAADEAYRKAIQINPADADSKLGIARLDLRAGRVAEAAAAAESVLKSSPDYTDALLVAGISAQRQGRMADARRHLERALGLAEQYVDVHIALGIVDFGEGRVADARRHFERAVQLAPARRTEVAVWLERTKESQ